VVTVPFDVAPLPAQSGSEHSGTIGGWGMSVSRYSKAQDASIQLVRYFTSPEFQSWRAQAATVVPTIQSVADQPAVQTVEPYLRAMADVDRVGRPSAAFADQYNQASTVFFRGVSQVLAGQDAAQVLPDVQNRLQRLMG
jgi:trehalose/maltose transport system substrate-binding protein